MTFATSTCLASVLSFLFLAWAVRREHKEPFLAVCRARAKVWWALRRANIQPEYGYWKPGGRDLWMRDRHLRKVYHRLKCIPEHYVFHAGDVIEVEIYSTRFLDFKVGIASIRYMPGGQNHGVFLEAGGFSALDNLEVKEFLTVAQMRDLASMLSDLRPVRKVNWSR